MDENNELHPIEETERPVETPVEAIEAEEDLPGTDTVVEVEAEVDAPPAEEEAEEGPHPGETPRFTFTYQIGKEMFFDYNEKQLRANALKGHKRMRMMGVIELTVFVFLVGSLANQAMQGNPPPLLYWALLLVVLGSGLFSIFYYPKFYPRKLRKASDSLYDQSSYLQNPITLHFYEDCMTEDSRGETHVAMYESMNGVVNLDGYYFFSIGDRHGVIMPKTVFADETAEADFADYLNDVRDRHYMQYTRR